MSSKLFCELDTFFRTNITLLERDEHRLLLLLDVKCEMFYRLQIGYRVGTRQ